MRIVMCDNPESLSVLKEYIGEYFRKTGAILSEITLYNTGEQLLENENHPDVAILGSEICGTVVGEELLKRDPYIKVFLLAEFPKYLDEGMRCGFFRYVPRPVDKVSLFKNLDDAFTLIIRSQRKIPIDAGNEVIVRRADEIVCVEKLERRTVLYTINGTFEVSLGMDYWRKLFLEMPAFFMSYRSFIINMKYVSYFDKKGILLKFGDNEKLAYLAQRRYKAFKEVYMQYLNTVEIAKDPE